jgi:hypothetical protein
MIHHVIHLSIMTAVFFASTLAGLALYNIIERGLLRRVERYAGAFLKRLGVSRRFATPLLLGLASPQAEHAVLSQMYKEKRVEWREIAHYIIATMPLKTLNFGIRFSYIPALAALGPAIGSIYIGVDAARTLLYLPIAHIFKKIFLKKHAAEDAETSMTAGVERRRGGYISLLKSSAYLTLRFALIFTAVEFVFSYISTSFGLHGGGSHFFNIVITTALMPATGFFALSTLLHSVGPLKGLAAIFIGRALFAILFEFPRHSYPFYLTFYPPKIAAKFSLIIMILSVATNILTASVLFCL